MSFLEFDFFLPKMAYKKNMFLPLYNIFIFNGKRLHKGLKKFDHSKPSKPIQNLTFITTCLK